MKKTMLVLLAALAVVGLTSIAYGCEGSCDYMSNDPDYQAVQPTLPTEAGQAVSRDDTSAYDEGYFNARTAPEPSGTSLATGSEAIPPSETRTSGGSLGSSSSLFCLNKEEPACQDASY